MCIVSFKTLTDAQRARSLLRSSGILCEVVGIDPNLTKRGCSYGVSFSDKDRSTALSVIDRRGISRGEAVC